MAHHANAHEHATVGAAHERARHLKTELTVLIESALGEVVGAQRDLKETVTAALEHEGTLTVLVCVCVCF